jgi:hypothetical protein
MNHLQPLAAAPTQVPEGLQHNKVSQGQHNQLLVQHWPSTQLPVQIQHAACETRSCGTFAACGSGIPSAVLGLLSHFKTPMAAIQHVDHHSLPGHMISCCSTNQSYMSEQVS